MHEYLASLRTNNGVTFNPALARMPQAYADWYAALQNAYGRWGPPAYQTLYTVFETGTLPSGVSVGEAGAISPRRFLSSHPFLSLGE